MRDAETGQTVFNVRLDNIRRNNVIIREQRPVRFALYLSGRLFVKPGVLLLRMSKEQIMEAWFPILFIIGYVILMRYVLPKLGVPT